MHSYNRTLVAKLGFADPDKKESRHDLAAQYLTIPENHSRLANIIAKPVLARPHQEGDRWIHTEGPGFQNEAKFRFVRSWDRVEIRKPSLEVSVQKGDGKYSTTVGFLDALLPFDTVMVERGKINGHKKREIELDLPAATRLSTNGHTVILSRDEVPEFLLKRFRVKDFLTGLLIDPKPQPAWAATKFECPLKVKVDFYEQGNFDHVIETRLPRDIVVEVKIQRVGLGDVLRQINLYREYYPNPEIASWVLATTSEMSKHDVDSLKREKIHHIRLGPKFDEYVAARQAERVESDDSPEL